MIGTTPLERARVRGLERTADLGMLGGVARVLHNTHSVLPGRVPNPEVAAIARRDLEKPTAFFDATLADGRTFVAGERPSIADCTLFAAFEFARMGELGIAWPSTLRLVRAIPRAPERVARARGAGHRRCYDVRVDSARVRAACHDPKEPSMLRRDLSFLAFAFATSVATMPARAADGEVEINQACVAAGCFAGDAPGFPVTITQSGSYRLTSNLSPTTAQIGIDVTANDVAIDLSSFTIKSTNVCAGPPGSASVCTVNNNAADGIILSGLRRGSATAPSSGWAAPVSNSAPRRRWTGSPSRTTAIAASRSSPDA